MVPKIDKGCKVLGEMSSLQEERGKKIRREEIENVWIESPGGKENERGVSRKN